MRLLALAHANAHEEEDGGGATTMMDRAPGNRVVRAVDQMFDRRAAGPAKPVMMEGFREIVEP